MDNDDISDAELREKLLKLGVVVPPTAGRDYLVRKLNRLEKEKATARRNGSGPQQKLPSEPRASTSKKSKVAVTNELRQSAELESSSSATGNNVAKSQSNRSSARSRPRSRTNVLLRSLAEDNNDDYEEDDEGELEDEEEKVENRQAVGTSSTSKLSPNFELGNTSYYASKQFEVSVPSRKSSNRTSRPIIPDLNEENKSSRSNVSRRSTQGKQSQPAEMDESVIELIDREEHRGSRASIGINRRSATWSMRSQGRQSVENIESEGFCKMFDQECKRGSRSSIRSKSSSQERQIRMKENNEEAASELIEPEPDETRGLRSTVSRRSRSRSQARQQIQPDEDNEIELNPEIIEQEENRGSRTSTSRRPLSQGIQQVESYENIENEVVAELTEPEENRRSRSSVSRRASRSRSRGKQNEITDSVAEITEREDNNRGSRSNVSRRSVSRSRSQRRQQIQSEETNDDNITGEVGQENDENMRSRSNVSRRSSRSRGRSTDGNNVIITASESDLRPIDSFNETDVNDSSTFIPNPSSRTNVQEYVPLSSRSSSRITSAASSREVTALPIEIPDNVTDEGAFRRYLSNSYELTGDRCGRNPAMGLEDGDNENNNNNPPTKSRPLGFETNRRTMSLAFAIMTLALLSSSASQLRFLVTYAKAHSYPVLNYFLISVSIIIEIIVGVGYVIISRFKFDEPRADTYQSYLIAGLFIVTILNVLIAAFAFTFDATSICETLVKQKQPSSEIFDVIDQNSV